MYRLKSIVVPLFLILFCFAVQIAEMGVDLPFLLNHGRYIADGNGFFTHDVFSMHTDFEFKIQQWLFCFVSWMLYSVGGLNMLRLLGGMSMAVSYWLLYRICRVYGLKRSLGVGVLVLCLPLMTYFSGQCRPYLFSVPILVFELYLLVKHQLGRCNFRYIVWLIPLGVLMINSHAAYYLFMFVVIMPFLADYLITDRGKFVQLLVVSVSMFLCGGINPYGIEMIWYPLKGVSEHSTLIVEEMSRLWNYPHVYLWSSFILGVLLLIYCLVNIKRVRVSTICFLFGSLILELYAIKLNLFSVLAMVVAFCDLYRCGRFDTKASKVVLGSFSIGYTLMAFLFLMGGGILSMACALVLGMFILFYLSGYHQAVWLAVVLIFVCTVKKFDSMADMDLAECVGDYFNADQRRVVYQLGREKARVYCAYNTGSYLEFYGCRAFLDTRAELYMESMNGCDDLIEKYFHAMMDRDFTYLDDYDFDYAVLIDKLNNRPELDYFLSKDDWEMVKADNRCVDVLDPKDYGGIHMFVFKYVGEEG